MENLKGSISIITNSAVLIYILKGVLFTLIISVTAVLLGLVLGSFLALLSNYCNKGFPRVFKWLATAYI